MKILNTIQELLYCPLCQNCGEIYEISSATKNFFIKSWYQNNNNLKICLAYRYSDNIQNDIELEVYINGKDNTLKFDETKIQSCQAFLDDVILDCCVYCKKCDNNYINCTITINSKNKEIIYHLYKRRICLFAEDNVEYRISLLYYLKSILILRNDVLSGPLNNKIIQLPLIELDFSRPRIVINKIKILLLFS